MNKLVSIVVPVYNSVAFLDKCVQSIVNQTYKQIEVILVNDGSTDTSGEVCDKYATIDCRIKVIHKQNGGLVSSRRAGISASTGEYVLYIDGDDWIEPELIQRYMEQVQQHNADIVVSSHKVNLEGRAEALANTLPAGVYNRNRLAAEVYPKMMYTGKFSQFGIFSYSWGKLYRRDILIDNQLEVTEGITIGEDALCLYPTLLDAGVLVILDEPLYHYRQRADSLIKTLRTIEISKMEKVYMDLKEVFRTKGVLDIMLEQLQYYILSILTVNTEGPTHSSSANLYPFDKVRLGDSIVLYGGGTFGQHIHKKISNSNSHTIVAWIDERYEYYLKLNLPVTGFSSLQSTKYDLVLITLIDEDNSNQAFSQLVDHGVDPTRIVQVSHYGNSSVQKLLQQYNINL
jgi:glycosyltransferase involved in cell wall biosynthesis